MTAPTTDTSQKQITQIITEVVNNMASQEEDSHTKHLHESLVMVRPSGNPLDLAGWKAMMNSQDVESIFSKLLTINHMNITDQMAYVCFTTHSQFKYQGQFNDDVAVFVAILKPFGEDWKVVYLQRSTGRKPEDPMPQF